MAEFRQIKCAMWREDDWFLDLPTDGKLLWVYLFSNPSASIAGIYRISLRTIANEVCLSQERVVELLTMFARDNKAHFADGVMWVVRMREHQAGKSPLVKVRIDKDLESLPHDNPVYCMYAQKYSIDTVSIPAPTILYDTDTNISASPVIDLDKLNIGTKVPEGVRRAYETGIGLIASPLLEGEIIKLIREHGESAVSEAFTYTADHAKQPSMAYAKKVLSSWKLEGKGPSTNGTKATSTLPPNFVLPPLPDGEYHL